MYDENASEGTKGTFEIYRAEADSLYKQGEYRKSIESYTIVSVHFLLLQIRLTLILSRLGILSCWFTH